MKNYLLLIFIILFSFFINNDAKLQVRYTAPAITFGASVNMNFAINDAYGRVGQLNSYGMRAGRGFDVFAKFGLGEKKRHRITTSLAYNKMINYDKNANFIEQIFSTNPDNVEHTNFTILTGSVGYEYLFGAPCCNKQHLGLAVTFNSISCPNDVYNVLGTYIGNMKTAYRIGLQFNAGYEFMLGSTGRYGLTLGFKYNWANLFNASNTYDAPGATELHLNDGNDASSGPGFTRWIGIGTINIGFNFYTGVKQLIKK
jgi:hypothetical protein